MQAAEEEPLDAFIKITRVALILADGIQGMRASTWKQPNTPASPREGNTKEIECRA